MSEAPLHSPAERFSAAILRLALALDERQSGFLGMLLNLLIGREIKKIRESLLRLGELLREGKLLQPIQAAPQPATDTTADANTGTPPRTPNQRPSQSPRPPRQPPNAAEAPQAPAATPPAPPADPPAAERVAERPASPPPATFLQRPRPAPAAQACGPPAFKTAPAEPAHWHADIVAISLYVSNASPRWRSRKNPPRCRPPGNVSNWQV